MRYSYWSSDGCSSDLDHRPAARLDGGGVGARRRRGGPGRRPATRVHQVLPARPRSPERHGPGALDQPGPGRGPRWRAPGVVGAGGGEHVLLHLADRQLRAELGRAPRRERGVQYGYVPGVAVTLKKTITKT